MENQQNVCKNIVEADEELIQENKRVVERKL